MSKAIRWLASPPGGVSVLPVLPEPESPDRCLGPPSRSEFCIRESGRNHTWAAACSQAGLPASGNCPFLPIEQATKEPPYLPAAMTWR